MDDEGAGCIVSAVRVRVPPPAWKRGHARDVMENVMEAMFSCGLDVPS